MLRVEPESHTLRQASASKLPPQLSASKLSPPGTLQCSPSSGIHTVDNYRATLPVGAVLSCTCAMKETAILPAEGKDHCTGMGLESVSKPSRWCLFLTNAAIAHPLCLQSVTGKSTHSGQETQSELFRIPTDQAPNTPAQRPPGLRRQSPSPRKHQLKKTSGLANSTLGLLRARKKEGVGELHGVEPRLAAERCWKA